MGEVVPSPLLAHQLSFVHGAANVRARELPLHSWYIAVNVVQCPPYSASVAPTARIRRTTGQPMYIDPAAGSLILQVLVAGVLAVVTTFKSARQSVARAFRDLFRSRKEK